MSKKFMPSRRQVIKGGGLAAIGAAAGVVPGVKKAVAAVSVKTPRWAFVVDLRRCTGCRACTVACKAEFNLPIGVFRAAVYEEVYGKFPKSEKPFLPRLCNHCEGSAADGVPPCVEACPQYPLGQEEYTTSAGKKISYKVGATYKRPDGLILYDTSKCIGCGACIEACPYGARNFHPFIKAGADTSEQSITKCTFCQHRIDQGVVPACVNICPPEARTFGDLNDPESKVSKLIWEFRLKDKRSETTLLPDQGTVPMVFYIDPQEALKKMETAKKNFQGESWQDTIL
ncbi:MAG: 4Fe-4S dicluster domain-containing protein [Candidatus Adiutricales bacterium]